jgi:hypothetical protein
MGGLQALAGLAMVGVGLSAPGRAPEGFLLAGASWLLPGLALGLSGVAVGAGWPSARRLCLLAVALAAAGVGTVAARRASLPPALADAGEWALDHPEAPPGLRKAVEESADGRGRETLRLLREPEVIEAAAPIYVGYCCCPVLPWYLLVLAAALSPGLRPAGKR